MMNKALADEMEFRHKLMYFSLPTLMLVLTVLLFGVLNTSKRLMILISEVFR